MNPLLNLLIGAAVIAIPLALWYRQRTGLSFWRHYFYATLMLVGLALLVWMAINGVRR